MRHNWLNSTRMLFDGATDGGGGGGQQQQNNGGQQQQQNNNGGGQQQQGEYWQTAALPDGMKGATAQETFEKLHNGWKGLREQTAKFAPPKDAAGYSFEPDAKLKGYFKSADDPMLGIAREVAHKTGVPANMFGSFINGVFTAAVEKGILPPPWDPHAEIDGIGNLVAPGKQGTERIQAIEAAVKDAEAFAPALADGLKLSPAAKKLLVGISQEAGGVELLRALKAGGKEFGLQNGGQQQQQGYSWADYDRDVADPRYQALTGKFDKSFRDTVDAKMRALGPRG